MPPPSVAETRLDRRLIAISSVVILGAIMSILDVTVVNVAINKLTSAFAAPLSTIQWVATGYTLALATVIPLSGWACDRFGAKRVYMLAVVLFVGGSALTGMAWSAESLIMFRVLQGLGGGMIMPAGMTILTRAAGPHRLGRIMSVMGIPLLMGPILGPILGGWLVDQVSWRWIFYINVPIGLAAFVSALTILPRDRGERGHRFDYVGALLLSPGLALFIYGLAESASAGGLRSVGVWGPALAGLVLMAAFTVHALRSEEPLIDLRMFWHRVVGSTGLTMLIFIVAVMGAMLLMPLYFQIVRGESAFASGLLLAPQGIGAMITMQLGGRLTDRIGPGLVIAPGIAVCLAGMLVFGFLGADTPYWLLCGSLFVNGFGMGLAMMPIMSAVMAHVPPAAIARASTSLNIIQQAGASMGTALMSIVLSLELVGRLGGGEGGALAAARSVPPQLRATMAPVIAGAFAHTWIWALVLLAASLIPATVLFQSVRKSRTAPQEDLPDEYAA
jgi:EmrB/QacA subfamily drug resistance transporter